MAHLPGDPIRIPALRELLDLPAPAKLNLFLHVTGRRSDGYHELETVFELIDLQDRLDLRLRDDDRIRLQTPLPGVEPDRDLTVRAARLLAQAAVQEDPSRASTLAGVDIAVRKQIPMGAGLGGGSSDAATVLLGLDRLWRLGWPRDRLAALGARLGADVPVFVFGRTAYATGIGDRLQALSLPITDYVLLMPPVEVPTATVFQAPELTRTTKPLKIDSLSQLQQVFLGKNDLQPVVLRRFAPVAKALDALVAAAESAGLGSSAARLARMSGSGASVFLPVDSPALALQVLRHLHNEVGWREGKAWAVRSLPQHPLLD